jgi:hypothetical protein
MTRKDFQELATILGETKAELELGLLPKILVFENLQDEIISFCKRSNSNFDTARFIEAIEKAAK